jgi:hypothetical protein
MGTGMETLLVVYLCRCEMKKVKQNNESSQVEHTIPQIGMKPVSPCSLCGRIHEILRFFACGFSPARARASGARDARAGARIVVISE